VPGEIDFLTWIHDPRFQTRSWRHCIRPGLPSALF